VYTFIYIHIHACTHVHILIYIYVDVYIHICMYTYIHMFIYICMCTYIYIWIWMIIYVYKYSFEYINIIKNTQHNSRGEFLTRTPEFVGWFVCVSTQGHRWSRAYELNIFFIFGRIPTPDLTLPITSQFKIRPFPVFYYSVHWIETDEHARESLSFFWVANTSLIHWTKWVERVRLIANSPDHRIHQTGCFQSFLRVVTAFWLVSSRFWLLGGEMSESEWERHTVWVRMSPSLSLILYIYL